MNRLMEETVFVGLVMACLLAGSPTFLSPFSTNATMEGVVRFPSLLGITTGSLPSITDTQEFVVPKSIPIILLITILILSFYFIDFMTKLTNEDYAIVFFGVFGAILTQKMVYFAL
jgi:hypothetical protein